VAFNASVGPSVFKLRILIAICVMALNAEAAHADSIFLSGVPTGNSEYEFSITTNGGQISFQGGTTQIGSGNWGFSDSASLMLFDQNNDLLATYTTATSIFCSPSSCAPEIGVGGGVLPANTTSFIIENDLFTEGLSNPSGLIEISGNFTVTPTLTPLPPTLPLFASGLGAMGLLGWRRKRKATVAT
jgi:hypothetical protein